MSWEIRVPSEFSLEYNIDGSRGGGDRVEKISPTLYVLLFCFVFLYSTRETGLYPAQFVVFIVFALYRSCRPYKRLMWVSIPLSIR
ncbi:hypothetical protein F4813DRAFT_302869 [Daldinia decipiens]|uniref:uncharacterized protein n=1 Tax=Daldinia decipiens TaxID=326647 RepID=UPI0020C3DACF|nr:uncharacterized protein F4813DRAFT_302869 [Daldinia decipiens]KAI1652719.1 hypothetical protein F4813DRAFT_302869 [Daldinia decipiens]